MKMRFVLSLLIVCALVARAYAAAPDYDQVSLSGLGNLVQSVATDDFDGDGNYDLVGASTLPKAVVVYYGAGDGTFSVDTLFSGGNSAYFIATGYVDGDDLPDIVGAEFGTGEVRVFLNNGDRTFTALTPFISGVTQTESLISIGYVNDDADADLMVCGSNGCRLYFGDGSGGFSYADSLFGWTHGVGLVDLDDDGYDDAVVLSNTGNGVSLYLGNGDGTFTYNDNAPAATPWAAHASAGQNVMDFNEDGSPDILVISPRSTSSTVSTIDVVMTDGAGGVLDQLSIDVTGIAPEVTAFDYNNDNHLDILATNTSEKRMLIYLGDGTGEVTDTLEFSTGDVGYLAITAADFREDGQWDIFGGSIVSDESAVFLNNATPSAPLLGGDMVTRTRRDIGLRMCNPADLTVDKLSYHIAGARSIIRDADADGSLDQTLVDLNVQEGVYYAEIWSRPGTPGGASVTIPLEVGGESLMLAKNAIAPAPGEVIRLAVPVGAVQPVSPRSGGVMQSEAAHFDWSASAPVATQYEIQIATTWNFDAPVYDVSGLTTPEFTPPSALTGDQIYYWHYRSYDGAWSGYSDTYVVTAVSCGCPYQGDLDQNGSRDALDLNSLIDVLFFGGSDIHDDSCPVTRSDFNADGVADALDLNALVEHLFFGGAGPTDACGF